MSAEIAAALRFRRDCEKAWRLGPRAFAELLSEIATERLLREYVEGKVARYAAIDPAALATLGGDIFPAGPIREIGT